MPDCCDGCYHTITFHCRSLSEYSIEHILEEKNILKDETVNVFISGCPALLLFELTILKNNNENLFIELFKKALYYEEWKSDTYTISTNDVCFVLNKLHTCMGFDALYLVRHGKNKLQIT
jgi:hypothetical protein